MYVNRNGGVTEIRDLAKSASETSIKYSAVPY